MASKTKIEKRLRKKTNPEVVSLLIILKKKNPKIASLLAGPKRKAYDINLGEIDRQCKEGDKILVPGKVLSQGEITKKIKLVALNASEKAIEKMKKFKIEFVKLIDEVQKNPELKDLKLVE